MPDLVKLVTSALVGLFLVFVFATLILPALGEATGQSTRAYGIALFFIALSIVVGLIAAVRKVFD